MGGLSGGGAWIRTEPTTASSEPLVKGPQEIADGISQEAHHLGDLASTRSSPPFNNKGLACERHGSGTRVSHSSTRRQRDVESLDPEVPQRFGDQSLHRFQPAHVILPGWTMNVRPWTGTSSSRAVVMKVCASGNMSGQSVGPCHIQFGEHVIEEQQGRFPGRFAHRLVGGQTQAQGQRPLLSLAGPGPGIAPVLP